MTNDVWVMYEWCSSSNNSNVEDDEVVDEVDDDNDNDDDDNDDYNNEIMQLIFLKHQNIAVKISFYLTYSNPLTFVWYFWKWCCM